MKYIRFYLAILRINFSNLLTYRFNFVINILGSLGWGFIGIVNMFIITSKIGGAYGWSKEELILLASIYPIFIGVFYLLFSNNIGAIPDIVNRGELDSFILKPIDSQLHVSVVRMDFAQIFRIIAVFLFTLNVIHIFNIHIAMSSFLLTVLLLIIGMVLVYSLWFSIITISLWFTTLTNLKDLLYFSNGILRYPTQMFLKKGNILLSCLSLFTLALSIPLRTFFQKAGILEIGLLLFAATVMLVFSRWFWKFALRFYTSASS